jgi:hypothetical protein
MVSPYIQVAYRVYQVFGQAQLDLISIFDFGLEPFFATASKNTTRFKSNQKCPESNHLSSV